MAYSKARRLSDLISADGTSFVTAAHITDGVVAAADLHSTLDLTGKTVTVATASAGDNDTTVASTAFVSTAVSNLVDSAPGTLNTLNELAAALGDDANFSTTVTNSIALKAPLASPDFTGQVQVTNSGTTVQEFLVTGNNTRSSLSMQSKDSSGNAVDLRMHSLGDGPRGEIFTFTNHDLAFATNNAAPQMILKTDGKLGLGTTSPTEMFHIKKTSGTGSFIRFQDTGGSGVYIGGRAEVMEMYTNGSEKMRIQSDGKVGIGDNNPFAKLHVEDTGWSSGAPYGTIAYIEGGAVNDLNWGHLVVSQSGTTTDTGGRISFGANGQNPIAGIRTKYKGATYGDLAFLTRPSGGTNTERMLIASNGNVGINIPGSQGVTQPAQNFEAWDGDGVTKLGIGNNAAYVQRYQTHATAPASLVIDKARGTQASPSIVSPGDDLGRIIFRGYTNGHYEAASIHVEANTSNLVNNGADIPSDIYFKTTRDGGSGPLERMRIDYDGGIWHRNGSYGKYSWGRGVVFTAGQTQNLYFHLNGSNVFGSVRVHLAGDYGNVNTNGAMENVWGWGYNSSNQSQYGGGGGGTATIREGSTSNVFSFGSMTKTNNTTVKIPITNGNGSYQIHTAIFVEVIGETAGLGYISIS